MEMNRVTATQFRGVPRAGKAAGIHLPNFNDVNVYTEKKTDTSESKYKKAIIEQAIKDQSRGKFQNESQGFNQLMKRYVSEVSPDRKGIITRGLKAIDKNRNDINKPLDILALLLDGEVKYQDSGIDSPYIEFYDSNGEMVATYSNNGWTMFHTKAETGRQIEMCSIYNKAWGNAAKKSQEVSYCPASFSESQSASEAAFDLKA